MRCVWCAEPREEKTVPDTHSLIATTKKKTGGVDPLPAMQPAAQSSSGGGGGIASLLKTLYECSRREYTPNKIHPSYRSQPTDPVSDMAEAKRSLAGPLRFSLFLLCVSPLLISRVVMRNKKDVSNRAVHRHYVSGGALGRRPHGPRLHPLTPRSTFSSSS